MQNWHPLTGKSKVYGTQVTGKACRPLDLCNLGVHQGEILSSFLFSIDINDIESFMIIRSVSGLTSITNCKLFILFYADDTVLLSESIFTASTCSDAFCIYCKKWNFTVYLIVKKNNDILRRTCSQMYVDV